MKGRRALVSRLRRSRSRRAQSGFLTALLILVLVLVSAVVFLVTTNAGANLALRLGLSATGGSVTNVEGSLWRGLRVGELHYTSETLDVHARDVVLTVDWPAIAQRRLRVLEASVQSLDLALRSDDTAPAEPSTPFTMPEWPALPGSVELRRVALGELRVTQDGEPIYVDVRDVVASLSADSEGGLLVLESLSVRTPEAGADLRGTASVGGRSPLTLDVRVAGDVQQADLAAELDLTAQGTLEDLAVILVGSGEGMAIDASARLAPLSSTLPVRALRGTVRGIDPGAWVDGLPSALLNLTVDAQLDGVLLADAQAAQEAEAAATPASGAKPPAGVSAARPQPADSTSPAPVAPAPAPAEATDWRETIRGLTARISLSIDEGSLWQKQPLRGKLDARLEDARLPELALDLSVAKENTVRLRGAFGGAGDQITFALAAPRPAAFWPGLEGSARLEGQLRGMLEKHELTVAGRVDHPLLAAAPRPANSGRRCASRPWHRGRTKSSIPVRTRWICRAYCVRALSTCGSPSTGRGTLAAKVNWDRVATVGAAPSTRWTCAIGRRASPWARPPRWRWCRANRCSGRSARPTCSCACPASAPS
ncbi:hypothetical protein [Verticiella alkaliphila]|uniref:hypothetical protein n=1 Tax=Verticiella alkaliphila TaxID=2779529 RepID=UPI00209B22FD|nr:hypothetical protein [Verticiella sp. GG226]